MQSTLHKRVSLTLLNFLLLPPLALLVGGGFYPGGGMNRRRFLRSLSGF